MEIEHCRLYESNFPDETFGHQQKREILKNLAELSDKESPMNCMQPLFTLANCVMLAFYGLGFLVFASLFPIFMAGIADAIFQGVLFELDIIASLIFFFPIALASLYVVKEIYLKMQETRTNLTYDFILLQSYNDLLREGEILTGEVKDIESRLSKKVIYFNFTSPSGKNMQGEHQTHMELNLHPSDPANVLYLREDLYTLI